MLNITVNDSEKLFLEAVKFHKNKNLDKAIVLYKNIIIEDESHINAVLNLHKIYEYNKNYTKSLDLLNRALSKNQNNIKLSYELATLYNHLKIYDKALNLYKEIIKAISIDQNKALTYTYLGNSYSKLDQYKNALPCYLEALKLQPQDINTYINLATVYKNLNLNNEAIKSLQKVIEIQPNHTDAHLMLAKLKKKIINIGIDWGDGSNKNISLMKFSPLMLSYDVKIYSLKVNKKCNDIENFGLEEEDISQKLVHVQNIEDALSNIDIVITADSDLARLSSKMDINTWIIHDNEYDDYLDLYPKSKLFSGESAIFDIFDTFESQYKLKLKR